MIEVPLCYLDTNVFIDAVEGDENIFPPAQRLLSQARDSAVVAITSELTLAEVLGPNSVTGRKRLPNVERQYLSLLFSQIVMLHPVSRGVLLETARLRTTSATRQLKLPDAIHLATAIRASAQFFVSGDRRLRVPVGMKKVDRAALARFDPQEPSG